MRRSSLKFLLPALVMFFIIAAGGCGGSSGLGDGDVDNYMEIPENPVAEESSAAREETIIKLSLTGLNSIDFDVDSDGMPDLLDFYGIPQFHVNNPASTASVTAAAASDVLISEAVEKALMFLP